MIFVRQGLPWNPEQGEKRRLIRIVATVVPMFVLVTLFVTLTQLPEQKREELEKLPPQLAKVVLKKKELPKPIVKKKEEKKPEPKPEEKVAEKPKPKPKPEPKVAKKPKPKPKAKDVKLAREKAKNSGLLAMSSQLSKLSALADSVKLDTPKTITAKPIARKVDDKLASRATSAQRSAGVDETQLTTETQVMSLASRAVTEVAEAEEVFAAVAEEEAAQRVAAGRSTEEIRRTMDANKSAIHRIYNRALRKKPSLQGVITPLLVIEESGTVSSCKMEDSTINEPDLESKICNRLLLVNFGGKTGVERKTVRYPIELFPS